jgi:hypothetical protein
MEGLFKDSGIPSEKVFFSKLDALRKLAPTSTLLQINGNIARLPKKGIAYWIGDLHGDLEAVVSIVKQTGFLKAMSKKENVFLVFLGDYGDRGKKIIETINEVITLKLLYPDNVILLKGNHEQEEIAMRYGTYDIFWESYGLKGNSLFKLYCKTMLHLPVLSIAPCGIIGVHGGIPNRDIPFLDILNSKKGKKCVSEMTWNDPGEVHPERLPNPRGGETTVFGQKAFERFMKTVPASVMVRSHEYPRDGVRIMFSDRLATIFSNGSAKSKSSYYSHSVCRAVYLKTKLYQKKKNFVPSDFMEITY